MSRQWRVPTVLAALFFATPGTAAEPDKLPDGAKLRLGTSQGRFGPGFVLLPPEYTSVLASDGRSPMKFELGTWKPLGKVGDLTQVPVTISGDGKRAVTAASKGLDLWDLTEGKKVTTLNAKSGYWHSTGFTPDGKRLAVGGYASVSDKGKKLTATVYDAETGKEVAVVTVHQTTGVAAVLSDDGKRLATWGTTNSPMASADWSKMQIWDVATQEEVATIKLDSFPLSVALSPDGKTVAAAGTNGRVSLWSADTGQRTATLLGRTGLGRKLAFTPSGKTILTLCFDGAVQRWSVADAAMIDVVPAPAIPHLIVEKLIVAGEDRALVTGYSWSRSVAWEVPSGKLLMSAEGHGDPIRTLAFREGGKEIVTGSGLSEIYRWDSSSGKRLPDIRIAQAPQYQDPGLKLSATGTRAILSSGQVFDTANGTELFGFKPISSETRHHPRISPCGTKLCVVVTDVTPTPKSAWAFGLDLMTGKQLGDVPIPSSGGAFVSAAISPDGSKVFAAMSKRQDGKVSFSAAARNLKDGKVLSNFDFEEGGYQYPEVVMASDNTTAVVGTPTGRLYAVNYVAGTTLRDLSLKQRTFTCSPVFDSDGKRLAYAVAPNLNETATVIFVVNPATGKTLNEFRGHSKTVTSLLFAPDGKTLVSGSDDTTALVWDLSAGKPTGN